MQAGAVEAVLAEPRLAQGKIFPFIVAGGWGRTGNVSVAASSGGRYNHPGLGDS